MTYDRLFSQGTPVSSTNKTDRHDITHILLKVALNTITQLSIFINAHDKIPPIFIDIYSSKKVFNQRNSMPKLKRVLPKSRKRKREMHIANHITIDFTIKSETTASMA